MMRKHAKLFVAALAMALSFAACTDEETTNPAGGTPHDGGDDPEEIDWDNPQDGQRATFSVNGVDIEMIYVRKGSYLQNTCFYRTGQFGIRVIDTIYPVEQTIEEDYLIGKYEVTLRQWLTVFDENPMGDASDPDLPVTNIWLYQMERFADSLALRTGIQFRLPSLEEWQFAAMGGNRSLRYLYSGDNNLNEIAWYADNSGGHAHRVGQLKANELGLFDMCGNVGEPTQRGGGFSVRGGSYETVLDFSQSSYMDDLKVRDWYRNAPTNIVEPKGVAIGFRLAASASQAKIMMQRKK